MGVEALPRTIEWVPLDGADGVGGAMVRLVEQRALPARLEFWGVRSLDELIEAIQCLAVYKRFVMGFSPGYGWDGITVATLAMNSPVGVLLSAFLFGMLRSASISMSLTSQVTTEMISVLQGFIVMLVASPDVWNVLGHLWQRLKSCVGRGRKQEGAAE